MEGLVIVLTDSRQGNLLNWGFWWWSSLTPGWAISHIRYFLIFQLTSGLTISHIRGFWLSSVTPRWSICQIRGLVIKLTDSWLRNLLHGRFGDYPHWLQAEQSVVWEVWWLSSLTPGWEISHMGGFVIFLTDSRLSNQSQLTDRIKNPGLGVRSSQSQEKVPVIQQRLAIMKGNKITSW